MVRHGPRGVCGVCAWGPSSVLRGVSHSDGPTDSRPAPPPSTSPSPPPPSTRPITTTITTARHPLLSTTPSTPFTCPEMSYCSIASTASASLSPDWSSAAERHLFTARTCEQAPFTGTSRLRGGGAARERQPGARRRPRLQQRAECHNLGDARDRLEGEHVGARLFTAGGCEETPFTALAPSTSAPADSSTSTRHACHAASAGAPSLRAYRLLFTPVCSRPSIHACGLQYSHLRPYRPEYSDSPSTLAPYGPAHSRRCEETPFTARRGAQPIARSDGGGDETVWQAAAAASSSAAYAAAPLRQPAQRGACAVARQRHRARDQPRRRLLVDVEQRDERLR